MRPLHKLNLRQISTINKPCRLSDGGGLYLRVKSSTSKSWEFVWTRNGHKRSIGLGSLNSVSLNTARAMAQTARQAVADGADPKKTLWPTPDMSFSAAAIQCMESRSVNWRNDKTLHKWKRTIHHFCRDFGSRPISSIKRDDVYHILKSIWDKTPETARIVRGHLELIFNYAKGRGWYEGENPALWKGGLEAVLPVHKRSVEHFKAMEYSDIPLFIRELRSREATTARALEFCILTATRTSETLLATFCEIDFETATWSIPAARTKTGTPHVVPLSNRAVQIALEMKTHKISEYVFPGNKLDRPLSAMSMLMLLRRMGKEDVTTHGMRSAFRDWAGDETEFARDLIELCLGHSVGSAVERSYRRRSALERRRLIMQTWTDWCEGVQDKNVVSLYG